MRLLICMWWCRCGVDDGFGIMVVSGCSTYVTEPVDMVLVVTGRVLYVVGWAAAYYVRCCGGGLCWGASSMIVLMILVEYTTRVVTLCACVIILCWSGCDYFQCDREIHFMCDAGQCGVIIDGGRWLYVVWCHKYRHISAHTYVSASRR